MEIKKLGDTHNFGQFVYEENGFILKPRTLYWEFLFLSKDSPLRKLIEKKSYENGISNAFNTAPNLEFKNLTNQIGSVEKLQLQELENNYQLNTNDFQNIGAMLALCFWFGIGDLHRDNMKFGLTPQLKLIAFPVDIECIFDCLTHIHQTLLLPSEKVGKDDCGLFHILGKLQDSDNFKKIAMLKSFTDNINLYNSIHDEIVHGCLEETELNQQEIRIIPHDTKSYSKSIELSNWDQYFQSEIVQMKRGEIPYFFRYPHSSALYYYHEKLVAKVADFKISNLKLPSPVILERNGGANLIKLKTAILSLNYLAEMLNLKTEIIKLGRVDIADTSGVFSIYEQNNKILFSRN